MFYKIEEFSFLTPFIAQVDVIAAELKGAREKDMNVERLFTAPSAHLDSQSVYWAQDNGILQEQTGYHVIDGDHRSFAMSLYKEHYDVKEYDIPALFPKTAGMLQHVPGLFFSGFFVAGAGNRIRPHEHKLKHLIFHMLLNDLDGNGSRFFCGNEERVLMKKGDAVLFDYSAVHYSTNESTKDRLNFVIDFNPFANE